MTYLAAILGIIGAGLVSFAPAISLGSLDRHSVERRCLWWANAIWLMSNALWIIYGSISAQWAVVIQFSVFFILAARGVWAWR